MRTTQLTVFAPNDTAFDQMLPYRREKIYSMSPREKENYVKSYTLPKVLQTNSMNENLIEESLGGPASTNIFFNKRTRRQNEIVNGTARRIDYYANGAMIVKPNIRTQNGIIQMIDRVLDPIIPSKVYGYIRQSGPTAATSSLKFFTEVANYISVDYYNEAIVPIQTSQRFTMFVPTDEAIAKIPKEKLDELRSKAPELGRVVKQHAISDKAVYTSFVYNNEGFECYYGRVIFKKNEREAVYVSAGGVDAEITLGNLTLSNGVIHFVDSLLGFVYNTAREQIDKDQKLSQFSRLLSQGRKTLQDFLVQPTGVTVFAPMNESFDAVSNLPGIDFFNNQTLIDNMIELHLLEPGTFFEITNVNGDYISRMETRTQYRGWNVKIYSQGHDTWAEGGYVKARVIRPDVGVTNGFVHYIDGIFGVPSRDVPGIIYCEDWLIKSSYILSITGLNAFMKDTRLRNPLPTCSYNVHQRDFNYADPNIFNNNSSGNNQGILTQVNRGGCGESNELCDFTIFVPNGTTVENFQKTEYGRQLFQDSNRLRYVLKRHIALNKRIYLDRLSVGTHFYTSATGDEVRFYKNSEYYAEVYFLNKRARIIHSDLGATNGVIHIVDEFLFVKEDLIRDISSSNVTAVDFQVNPSTIIIGVQNQTTSLNISCTPTGADIASIEVIEIGKKDQPGNNPIIQVASANPNSVTIKDASYQPRMSTSDYINGTSGSLIMFLRDLRCTDAGLYYCSATVNTNSGVANDEGSVNVTVRTSPKEITMTVNPNRVLYKAGEEIQFSCSGYIGNREGNMENLWNWQHRDTNDSHPYWTAYPNTYNNITYHPKQASGNCQYTARSTLTHVVTAIDNGRQFRCYVINEMYGDNRTVYFDTEVSTSTVPTTSTVDTVNSGHGLFCGTGMSIGVGLMLVLLLLR